MDATWTLDELTQRVDAILRREGIRQDNGQVAEAPNGRTVRWYQSTGLLRRPEQRGRVAFYGQAHLAELVAIKRLQAEGLSLTDVQGRLHGLGDEGVFALAALPADRDSDAPVIEPAPDAARRDGAEAVRHDDAGVRSAGLSFWIADVADPVVSDAVCAPEPTLTAHIRQSLDHPAGVSLVLPTTIDADVAQRLLQRIVDELVAGGHLPTTSPEEEP